VKRVEKPSGIHEGQRLPSMKLGRARTGLVVNFNVVLLRVASNGSLFGLFVSFVLFVVYTPFLIA
jgi:hypothetical protein